MGVVAFERLEERTLLAGGLGTFGVIQGRIPAGTHRDMIHLTITRSEFSVSNPLGIELDFHVTSQGDGRVALGQLTETTAQGTRPAPWMTTSGGWGAARLVVGNDDLTVTGAPGTRFKLDVSLTGDVTGDFQVSPTDLRAIRAAVGARAGSPGYSAALDVLHLGRIGPADLRAARSNLGAATSIRPLSVGLETTRDSVTGSGVTVIATAQPGAVVELLPGATQVTGTIAGSGLATQQTDATGQAAFNFTVPIGSTTIAALATDSFGQRVNSGITVNREVEGATSGTVTLTGGQLMVGGNPFVIKGVAGPQQERPYGGLNEFDPPYGIASVANAGGNVIRTYGESFVFTSDSPAGQAADIQYAFNLAVTNNVRVIVGLWLLPSSDTGNGYTATNDPSSGTAYTTNGFLNYNDPTQVATQYGLITQLVNDVIALQNRSNAQLFWDIGNEVLEDVPSQTAANVYGAIDQIAKYIKLVDTGNGGGAFPCLTSIVVPTADALNTAVTDLPDLDLIGVNAYSGTYGGNPVGAGYLDQVEASFQASNWTKPWMITEFGSYDLGGDAPSVNVGVAGGPPGQPVTDDSYLWADSTAQAADYASNYQMIAGWSSAGCLGSCAFTWRGPAYTDWPTTWYTTFASPTWQTSFGGRFSPTASLPTQAVAALAAAWGGSAPANIPQITDPTTMNTLADPEGISYVGTDWRSTFLTAGAQYMATVNATSPDDTPLTYYWSIAVGSNGEFTQMVTLSNGTPIISTGTSNTFTFTAPAADGQDQSYRLICLVVSSTGAAKVSGVFGIPAS